MSLIFLKNLPWILIFFYAGENNLEPALLASVLYKESAGKNCLVKYEKKYRWTYKIDYYSYLNYSTLKEEERKQKTSWGMMQVMGAVAREYGFSNDLRQLCKPEISIHYGAIHLSNFMKKYIKMGDAIASYNAGSPRFLENGEYENQSYVNDVLKLYNNIKEYLK